MKITPALTIMLTLIIIFTAISSAQMTKQDSLWLPMKFFVGEWNGEGGGQSGNGSYKRNYTFILNKRFIEVKNKSIYTPQEKNPKGEEHEDIGYISYDRMRKKFVLRQFHIEGFINQYTLDSISADGKTIVFLSEAIENIPAGWRAKETYIIANENEFTETFELAPPGKGLEIYSKVTLKRVK